MPHLRLHGRGGLRRPPHDLPDVRQGRQGPDARGFRGDQAHGSGRPGTAQPDHHRRARERAIQTTKNVFTKQMKHRDDISSSVLLAQNKPRH